MIFVLSLCLLAIFSFGLSQALAETTLEEWTDAAREREVPVKFYWPAEGAKPAPITPAPITPAPIILASHGLGGSREVMSYLCQAWADAGFVVVAMQHVGSDESVWQGQPRPLQAMREAANAKNSILRVEDVRFVIDTLIARAAEDKRLDVTRIGLSGHSFGAQTTLACSGVRYGPRLTSFVDERIKASVALSPAPPENVPDLEKAFAYVRIPMLHITGTQDVAIIGNTTAQQRLMPYFHTNSSPQFLAVFDAADHMVFSGAREGGRLATRADPNKDPGRDEEIRAQVIALSVSFWKAYLLDDPKAKDVMIQDAKSFGDSLKFDSKHDE